MQEVLEFYKLVRNKVQLVKVELVEITCEKLGGSGKISTIKLGRDVQVIPTPESLKIPYEQVAEIKLRVSIEFEEDHPFKLSLTYKGLCIPLDEISEEELRDFSYHQVVPLLLPYARECVASTVIRMGLPNFTIPTMDVLQSIAENR